MRDAVLCMILVVGCGDNLAAQDAAIDAPKEPTATEYYALRVGAHWTFASGVEKRVTSCELVDVYDCTTQTHSQQRVAVRETWQASSLLEVHYLRVEPGVGVVRVRVDHPGGNTITWIPYTVRVVEGPYTPGVVRTFRTTRCERGQARVYDQVEQIADLSSMFVAGALRPAQHIIHGTEESWYVRDVGEVREVQKGTISEQLVSYEPGYADCP